jgi:TolB-like protein
MAYEKEIRSLSTIMAENIAKADKKSIAVVDFTDLQGNVTELGRFLAEEFSVALAGAGKGFEVVDRTHLKTILKEHKLSITGVIDPTTAKKLGQIAGVDALVTGTITPFGDSVRISVKILDTATAKVIGASSGDIPKTKAIEELLTKGINTEVTSSTERPTPMIAKEDLKAKQRVEIIDYIFEARGCKNSGGVTTCVVSIKNKTDMERFLSINASDALHEFAAGTIPFIPYTYLYNEVGDEYKASNIEGHSSLWGKGFMSNVPVSIKFSFNGVSILNTKSMTLIVGCYDNITKKYFRVTLANILLTK